MNSIYNHKGTEIILNLQFSKIGCGYPRIFIRRKDGISTNMDISINACFNMAPEDFQDWKEGAEIRTKEEFLQDFISSGIKFTPQKLDAWLLEIED